MNEKGISLVESLLASAMVGILVILLANLPNAFNLMNKSKHLSIAREIAAKAVEDKRSLGYSNLVNDTENITDLRILELPSGKGTTAIETCPAEICTSGENLKQITVTVNWQDNNKSQSAVIKTFIGETGIR